MPGPHEASASPHRICAALGYKEETHQHRALGPFHVLPSASAHTLTPAKDSRGALLLPPHSLWVFFVFLFLFLNLALQYLVLKTMEGVFQHAHNLQACYPRVPQR